MRNRTSKPMLFIHSLSITQQLMQIYNTNVHKNKTTGALMWLQAGAVRHEHATKEEKLFQFVQAFLAEVFKSNHNY